MIPYYSPNFGVSSFLKSLFIVKPEEKLKHEFKKIAGKKPELITSSCCSVHYLTYKFLGKIGQIITSPLTCKVAIQPDVASGNTSVYSDVDENSLLIDPDTIEEKVNEDSLGIQITHLGGYCCDVEKIEKIVRKKNLLIIEDCVQGLFSSYKGKLVGRMGYVICFSLIKNAYGIGGSILCTDDENIFHKAQRLQDEMDESSAKFIIFRVVRSMIEPIEILLV